MKNVLLFLVFVLVYNFFGQAQKSQNNNPFESRNGETSSVLLSRDYIEKVSLIKNIQTAYIANMLKSSGSKHKLDSIITEKWMDESLSYENSFKYKYKFNEDELNLNLSIYVWESENQKWIIDNDITYNFSIGGKLILAEFEMYFSPVYKKYTKAMYSYSDSLLTEEIIFTRYEEEDPWEETEQMVYNYDSNNWLVSVNINQWDNYEQIWTDAEKLEYTYDLNGNIITESGLTWGGYSLIWILKERIENNFDDENNMTVSIAFVPGWESEAFVEDTKVEMFYGVNSTLELELFYNWDYDLNGWLAVGKYNYSQNETDKLYVVTGYVWNKDSHSWGNKNKMEFLSINMLTDNEIMNWKFINVYLPVYLFNSEVSDLINTYNWINNEWLKTDISKYHFSPTTVVDINQLSVAEVLLYPNPVTDYLSVELNNIVETKFIIRDVNGRTVSQFIIFQKEQFNLSNYNSGLYFVELIQNGQRIFTGKILKR